MKSLIAVFCLFAGYQIARLPPDTLAIALGVAVGLLASVPVVLWAIFRNRAQPDSASVYWQGYQAGLQARPLRPRASRSHRRKFRR